MSAEPEFAASPGAQLRFREGFDLSLRPALFISDVDRTLLTHDHVLLPQVISAARSLNDAGIPLFLASARSPTGVGAIARELRAAQIACCFNGAWVGNIGDRRSIAEHRIGRETALAAMTAAHELGASPLWFDLDRCFCLLPDVAVARLRTEVTGDHLGTVDSVGQLSGAPFKILITVAENRVGSVVRELTARFGDRLTIAQSGPALVELTDPGAGKDRAAALIAARFSAAQANVAAAGDSDNDMGLLRWAGLAISPANARPHVQALADVVAPSCDEAGLAVAINWIVGGGPNLQPA